jgi:hypothetical protein
MELWSRGSNMDLPEAKRFGPFLQFLLSFKGVLFILSCKLDSQGDVRRVI